MSGLWSALMSKRGGTEMEVTLKFDAEDDQDVQDTLVKLSAEMIKLAKTCGDTSLAADIERRKVMMEINRLGDRVIALNTFALSHPELDELQSKTAEIAHLRQRIAELRCDLDRLYLSEEE